MIVTFYHDKRLRGIIMKTEPTVTRFQVNPALAAQIAYSLLKKHNNAWLTAEDNIINLYLGDRAEFIFSKISGMVTVYSFDE